MNSIADPAVVLSLLLNQGSVKQAQDQLFAGIKEGIARVVPEFEQIEAGLMKAIAKAPIESQLQTKFTSALRGLGRGDFAGQIDGLRALREEYTRLGDAERVFLVQHAEAVAKFGSLAGKVDVHPSWQNAKTGELWRRVHTEEAMLAGSAGRLDAFNSGSYGTSPSAMNMQALSAWQASQKAAEYTAFQKQFGAATSASVWRRVHQDEASMAGSASRLDAFNAGSYGTSPKSDMMQRLSAWQRGQTALEVIDARARRGSGVSPESIFANMDLSDQGNAIRRAAGRDPEATLAGMNLGSRTAQGRFIPLSQRDAILNELAETMDAKSAGPGGRWASKDNIHRFRFAAQNVGFGIDDAIQSYHYGGIPASIRAASNNVTAIAGMTIQNPALAAATVVGLSVATAAMPVIYRRMIQDVGLNDKLAAMPYERHRAGTIAEAARGEDLSSKLNEEASAYFKLGDENANTEQHRAHAHATLKRFGQRYSEDGSFFQRTAGMAMGGRSGAEYNAALKFLDDDIVAGPGNRAKQNEHLENIRLLQANTNFTALEQLTASRRQSQGSLYRADSVQTYEAALMDQHSNELSAVASSKMTPDQQRIKIAALDFQLQQSLSQRSGNTLTVAANVRERQAFMRNESLAASGFSDPISSLNSAFASKQDSLQSRIEQGLISSKDGRSLIAAFAAGTAVQKDISSRDFVLTAFGGADPLRTLVNATQDRAAALAAGARQNPAEIDRYVGLMSANSKGFARQREDLMTSMKNDFKVTTPIGKIADDYAIRAKKYQEMFDANPEMTLEEQRTLTTNLQKSYSVAMRDANRPSGTERFTADGMVVGGAADRELQGRMLGNFLKDADDSYKEKSLSEFTSMAKSLGIIQEKLEAVRLGL